MLKQRIVTAVVLLAILLPALFAASPWPFALLTLVLKSSLEWRAAKDLAEAEACRRPE